MIDGAVWLRLFSLKPGLLLALSCSRDWLSLTWMMGNVPDGMDEIGFSVVMDLCCLRWPMAMAMDN